MATKSKSPTYVGQITSLLNEMGSSLTHLELIVSGANMRPIDIVDQAARLRQAKARIEILDKLLCELLKSVVPNGGSVIGDMYQAVNSISERTNLDTEKIRDFLGQRVINFQKTSTISQLTFKPRL